MHKDGYYSSGEFAKRARITLRTVRYYDKLGLLKPSLTTEEGARFYTDTDFTRLQQILLLKYLGFSLEDIKNMTVGDSDLQILKGNLMLQKKLVEDRIAQMQLVARAIDETAKSIESSKNMDWDNMLELIHLTNMEDSLKTQYLNAGNISARIDLHKKFSVNRTGWFPWIYEMCDIGAGIDRRFGIEKGGTTEAKKGTAGRVFRILEIGCGDGALWKENIGKLAMLGRRFFNKGIRMQVELTDISEGMIRDARSCIEEATRSWKDRDIGITFRFKVMDCEEIGVKDNTYDLVIANHCLFYCGNVENGAEEIYRVLKKGGRAVCGTYGPDHMKEISSLVKGFDNRIELSKEMLFEKFGLNNGPEIMSHFFGDAVEVRKYDDSLRVNEAEPLIEYILSCHGNQNQYILDRFGEFKTYVNNKVKNEFRITKDAGVIVCIKG